MLAIIQTGKVQMAQTTQLDKNISCHFFIYLPNKYLEISSLWPSDNIAAVYRRQTSIVITKVYGQLPGLYVQTCKVN